MALIERSFDKINKEFRYGVIYVITSFNRVWESDMSINHRLPSQLLEWLRRLTGFDVKVIEVPGVSETKLVARRINVGNAGKEAVVEMPLRYDSFKDVQRFAESATDVLSTDEGNKVLEQELIVNRGDDIDYFDESEPSKRVQEEISEQDAPKKSESLFRKLVSKLNYKYRDSIELDPLARADVELEEEEELLTIEKQKEDALKAIQAQILDYVRIYQDDPMELINTLLKGKIVIGQNNGLSPLVVNNDLKIVLPNYNEVEVKMPAMCRAIYILFLKHPEGIALRNIGDHRAELENIYSIVMPGRSEERAREAIYNLVNPMSNTLNEYISKIKRCFKSRIINDELADKYCITGKKTEPYKIALDPSLITLPRAVMDE